MILTKHCRTKVAHEPGERWVLARINTIAIDRDGDVLMPSGVILDDFNVNPVVNFGHPTRPGGHPMPVGKVVSMSQKPSEIVAKVLFSERPAEHPEQVEWVPDTLMHLFKEGILRGFSVGFTVGPGGVRAANMKDRARFGDGVERVITKWRLAELSIVAVPANQEALAMAVSKGFMPRDSWVRHQLDGSADELLDILDDAEHDPLVVPSDDELPMLEI